MKNEKKEYSKVEESLTIEDELQQKDTKDSKDKQQSSSKDATHGKKPNCYLFSKSFSKNTRSRNTTRVT